MKIGIITFLHNENYGSTLQAWALQHVLRSAGYDAFHFDYAPDTREKVKNMIASGNSPALLLDGFRKRRVRSVQSGAQDKAASFRAFYQAHMRLSAPCHDCAALASAAKGTDVLISGSDQIWSPVWFNPAYFLNFAVPGQKRISYAASLGVSQWRGSRKQHKIAKLVSSYDAVSVREEEGAALLSEITERRIDVMPDPVSLVNREDWLSLAVPYQAAKPYIACYMIGDRPDYWERVARMKQETDMDVVVIPVTQTAYELPYTITAGLSPEEWLGVLAGAEHVITDSFHGTIFSLLLGRTVTILRRYREDDPESKNSRIDNLLRQLGISGETIAPSAEIDAGLAELRSKGTAWLLDKVSPAAR